MKKTDLKKSFKRKVTLNSILLATLPVLILGLFLVLFLQYQTKIVIESKIKDSVEAINKKFSSQVISHQNLIFDLRKELKEEQSESQMLTKMYKAVGSNSDYFQITLIQSNLDRTLSTGEVPQQYELPKYQHWGIFRELSSTNRFVYYTNVYKNEIFEKTFTIAQKFTLEGEEAYLILDFSTEYFQNLILDYKNLGFGTQQFIIIGEGGEILYNDSVYTNEISFYNQQFVQNRFSPSDFLEGKEGILFRESDRNKQTGIKIIALLPDLYLKNQAQVNAVVILVLLILAIIIGSLVGIHMGNSITNPILTLSGYLENIKHDKVDTHEIKNRDDELGLMAHNVEALFNQLNQYHQTNLDQTELLKVAEIKALMSQINPHFLYNTLDTIKWQARFSNNLEIEETVTDLGFILRASMNQSDTLITVKEELEFINNYLRIQKKKYEDKFEFILNVQKEVLDKEIPKFILQPLIENALVHGIEPKENAGLIELNAWIDDNYLFFSVADDGVGTEVEIKDLGQESIGINNVNQRIKLHYGEEYSIQWKSIPEEGTVVYIKIPAEEVGDTFV